jgi:hypothetical protein
VLVVIGNDGGLSRRSPRPAARGEEQEAAFIEADEMGPKSLGFFFWRAIYRASTARSRARCAGGAGVPAPDSSNPGGVRSSRRARDESVPRTPPECRPRCALASTARWGSHKPWHPSAATPLIAAVVAGFTCLEAWAPAWGPRRLRPLSARPRATDTPSSPMPAPGAPPRFSSTLASGASRRGVAVVPRSWVIQRVSCCLS